MHAHLEKWGPRLEDPSFRATPHGEGNSQQQPGRQPHEQPKKPRRLL